MDNFKHLFSTFESTDTPPIITQDYQIVKQQYEDFIYPTIKSESPKFEVQDPITYGSLLDQQEDSTQGESTQEGLQSHDNTIVNYFLNKGLTLNQAKGIYGNIMQESAGRLSIVSRDGYNSYGLAQWTGDRKDRLFRMYGTKPTLQNQLDFMWWELNNTEKKALKELKETKTVEDATRVFMKKYERPAVQYAAFNRRLNFARSV